MDTDMNVHIDKYYVKSGELMVVLLAESPMFAAMEALERFGNYVDKQDRQHARELHHRYIWVDDQGFRDFSAKWKLLISEVMDVINNEQESE